jgi:hypothetical protein
MILAPRKTEKSPHYRAFLRGGDVRIRTADPLHAKQVLYQLSYTPTMGSAQIRSLRRKALRQSEQFAFSLKGRLLLRSCQVWESSRSGRRCGRRAYVVGR